MYPVAAYRGVSMRQMAGAWEGPPGHPHGALYGLSLSFAGWKVLYGFIPRKWFVSGEMITFTRSKLINQNSNVLN